MRKGRKKGSVWRGRWQKFKGEDSQQRATSSDVLVTLGSGSFTVPRRPRPRPRLRLRAFTRRSADRRGWPAACTVRMLLTFEGGKKVLSQ